MKETIGHQGADETAESILQRADSWRFTEEHAERFFEGDKFDFDTSKLSPTNRIKRMSKRRQKIALARKILELFPEIVWGGTVISARRNSSGRSRPPKIAS